MRIRWSARKHGIADEDIAHAVHQALSVYDRPDETRLYLGPGRTGHLLEVVTVLEPNHHELAIHAMPVRRKYELLLRGRSG